MLRAVIFDFDGVITDSEILHFRAFNKVLGRYGVSLTKTDYYTTFLGLTDVECYGLLIEQGRLNVESQQIDDLVQDKKVIFKALAQTEGRIIEDVHDFVGMLKDNRIPMAICSGALLVEIEYTLQETDLRDSFEAIVSAEHVRRGKPSPEGFLLALKQLNDRRQESISAPQCIVIEDSRWGLEAAKAAGMKGVAVTNTYSADQLGLADRIVDRLGELTLRDLQQLCA